MTGWLLTPVAVPWPLTIATLVACYDLGKRRQRERDRAFGRRRCGG